MTARTTLLLMAAGGVTIFLAYRFAGVGGTGIFLGETQGRVATEQPALRTSADRERSVAAGKALFAERCAQCHGSDARGGFCPDLTRRKFKYGKSRADLGATISFGRSGGRMPAYNRQLSPQQVSDLVEYILSLS